MTEQEQREAVIAEARKWIDTPFRHDAEVLGAGVDCAHIVNAVYSTTGHMPHLKFPHYPPDWWKHAKDPEQHIVENAKKYFREISAEQATPGDWVVLFLGKAWAHCVILTGEATAIEAWPTKAAVAEINIREERLYSSHEKRYFTSW